MGPGLTRDAERFIERHLYSTGTLDLLLLLRSRSASAWSAAAICELLRCPPSWAQLELARLRAAGLLVADGEGYRYAPASPRQRAAVDSLAGAWRRNRASVTRLILTPRQERSTADEPSGPAAAAG